MTSANENRDSEADRDPTSSPTDSAETKDTQVGSNQRSGTEGQRGAATSGDAATGGTGSDDTADAVEHSGDPGARGGYGEAAPGGSASRLAGEPSGTTASRSAEPFNDDGEPFDEDP